MGRNRRRFRRGEAYFVTCRAAYGLPFMPNLYMRLLICGLIARAQELYPAVTVCHLMVMSNHYHFVVVLNGSADQMKDFFGYINGELASIINRLQGVSHRKFWAKRYDAKPLLTPYDVIEKIIYCYFNPVKALLVDKAKQWEGASSLSQFLDGQLRYYKWLSSSLVKRLPRGHFTKRLLERCMRLVEDCPRTERELKLCPFAWKKCFAESAEWNDQQLQEDILNELRKQEDAFREKRLKQGKKIVGLPELRRMGIYRGYVPKTHRRNSLATSGCKEALVNYRAIYLEFCRQCKEVWQEWKCGNFRRLFPPGAFIPPFSPMATIYSPG